MKYNKVEALLKLNDMNISDFARHLNVSRQQISNKKKNDTFRADELIQLAELTNTNLSFTDKETGKIIMSFDINDVQKGT